MGLNLLICKKNNQVSFYFEVQRSSNHGEATHGICVSIRVKLQSIPTKPFEDQGYRLACIWKKDHKFRLIM